MTCQKLVSAVSRGGTVRGTNLRVVPSSARCQQDGNRPLMVIADCWAYPPPPDYGGWCLLTDEQYSIVDDPGQCENCNPQSVLHDCVNGNCVSSSTYNTPGNYPSLAACQSACSGNSAPCNGECIQTADITALNQAITDLQGRYCS